jgi:hypothetical protein
VFPRPEGDRQPAKPAGIRRLLTAIVLDPDRPHPGFNNPPAGTNPGMFQAKQAVIGAVMVVFGVAMIIYGATH